MTAFEVPSPILNSPFAEPAEHWLIREGEMPERRPGRRDAGYFFRDPRADEADGGAGAGATWVPLDLVNLVRQRVAEWRLAGRPGISRTTDELIRYWNRDGRGTRLFFAQIEAVETVIFLTEARPDLRQGIDIPADEPADERQALGYRGFRRLACKMATGSGKTTVMGMLAAWSILNKVASRRDPRFSDTVLVVCPNVTIRSRLGELDPLRGDASLYVTRDLVPERLRPDLAKGRLIVTNWHVFEPRTPNVGGDSARVTRLGVPRRTREVIHIGSRTTTARGYRYLTEAAFNAMSAAGEIENPVPLPEPDGIARRYEVDVVRWVESDTALIERVLGREVGGKRNILVLNDEAHHAYRMRQQAEDDVPTEEEDADEYFVKEATIWIDGLDKVHKLRGINACIDLSATPYFIGRAGADTNKVFPWVVSDFGLTDAIESGLVKIPQLAVRDTTGAPIPGYFNIWRWIIPNLTTSERGGRRGNPKPEAVLRWAHTPIAMLAGLWDELRRAWAADTDEPRPPVFIIVCKNTRIGKVVFDWLAEDKAPTGVPSANLPELCNRDGRTVTIRVDSKVVEDTDSENAKSDELAWLRHTLDTVGQLDWPRDALGQPIRPDGFVALADKLGRSLDPPGRAVRCIVSVGMLTEGWDCNTVTHIIGLRPFMSQLLCEQVVGRGLRRQRYAVGDDDRMTEEVAKVLGVPFAIVPFKANPGGSASPPRPKQHHVRALPDRNHFEIRFPRIERYRQAVRRRIAVDWSTIAPLKIDPTRIPPEVQVKATLPSNQGRPSLFGPGLTEDVTLDHWARRQRLQHLIFQMARDLTREIVGHSDSTLPAHVVFPQMVPIVEQYLREKVERGLAASLTHVFVSPYYGYAVERLLSAIRPDTSAGEAPELPVAETTRGDGSTADVAFWTSREVREVNRSHVNYVVADTRVWEQSAAYRLDTHPTVAAFVKNAGLGFAIPYMHDGERHDYEPDFIVRQAGDAAQHLILETKGFDPLAEVKAQAASRWVAAVNAAGRWGTWRYALARSPEEVSRILEQPRAAAS